MFQDVTPNPGPAEYSGLTVDELQAISGTGRIITADPQELATLSQKISKFSLDEECHELQY